MSAGNGAGNGALPKLNATVESVTPEMASRLLGTMVRNRRRREGKVHAFARDMIAGHWQLNGEPIIIGHDGRVVDGQHRLQAVIEAKLPVPMLIVRGVKPEAMATIDTGSNRMYADVIQLRGDAVANGSDLAAIARLWWQYETNKDVNAFRLTLSHAELDEIIKQHPTIPEGARISRQSKFRRHLPLSVMGFTYSYLTERVDREIADLFLTTLESGADLPATSPILVLRNRLINAERLTQREFLALVIKAYNLWMEGHSVKTLVFSVNEDFPRFGVVNAETRQQRRKRMEKQGIAVEPTPVATAKRAVATKRAADAGATVEAVAH